MHMLDPRELERRRDERSHKQKAHHRRGHRLSAVITLVVAYGLVVAVLPVASLKIAASVPSIPVTREAKLPWPSYGQAAIGAVGYGLLAQHGDPTPLPIASVAKILTAMAVLKEKPIIKGQTQNILTITEDDMATYQRYALDDQSVVQVAKGEQLSEYQALQALLLPSANNMADALAHWAFGSMDNYTQFANSFAKTIGMQNTTIADASGYLPQTTSTAVDLTKLAEIAMNNPTIAEIVGQAQVDLPVAGTVYNVNKLVGHDGIVGIKTGNTDQAGGCYMFAARRQIAPGQTITLVGTNMGAQNLSQAIEDATPLIDASFKQFQRTTVLQKDQPLGTITQAGGKTAAIVSAQRLDVIDWSGHVPKVELKTTGLGSSVQAQQEVGQAIVMVGNMSYTVPVISQTALPHISYGWRLRHAAGYL